MSLLIIKYEDEWKDLQYFGNIKHNSSATDDFIDVWWTTTDCETSTSPDTLYVLLTGFASMAWSTVLESTVLNLPDQVRTSRLFHP